ncbi:succinylglutamate desuccinylase [Haloarchaeobius sp. TZWWS8]|uniref:succinylglutamate desuccinylase n=1 Tax=Haloarchaeobius sp. TZWWS8 TaxID=3446121 RepID=UPI003EC08A85
MEVHQFGSGTPVVAVVACVHGDEVCGERAIQRVREADPDVRRPFLTVLANEEAVERGVRYLDEDLNRAFPGDPNAATHEGRLAAELLEELEDIPVLDLHSTLSTPEPFALYQQLGQSSRRILAACGVDHAVDISYVPGGLVGHVEGVAVECGIKGTDAAADAAEQLVWNVLAAMGAVDRRRVDSDPTVFEVNEVVDGSEYEFLGENFRLVERGAAFARRDEHELRAETDFYPVLMSTDGYDDMVGFGASKLGPLSTIPDAIVDEGGRSGDADAAGDGDDADAAGDGDADDISE